MKHILFTLVLLTTITTVSAQQNLDELLASGVEDAQTFTQQYITPGAEGLLWNTTSGWMQGAKVKKVLGFEFSVMGSATLIKDEQKSFTFNNSDYNNLELQNGNTSQEVATAFGENNPDVLVVTTVENEFGFEEEVEIVLPQGLGSENISFLPTAFLQARLGVFKATEVKVRYFPKIEYEDIKTGLVGIAVQHEISQWFPGSDVLPIRVSALVSYTNTSGEYDFTDEGVIEGENQRFELTHNSYTVEAQVSTKLPIINFYGGLGYVTGTSEFDILGTYRFRDATPIFGGEESITDPFSIENDISGVRATLGLKLNLGFFGLHADYNIADYNTVSAGVHFGI
jgi:hypothetical protein